MNSQNIGLTISKEQFHGILNDQQETSKLVAGGQRELTVTNVHTIMVLSGADANLETKNT